MCPPLSVTKGYKTLEMLKIAKGCQAPPSIRAFCVQSHDILYRVSRDIPYTPLAREAGEGERCLGRRWTCESSE